MVDGTGVNGNVDGNPVGEFVGGRSGETNLWRAKFYSEKSFFNVARADLLGEEDVYGEARVGFTAKFAEMRLDGAVCVEGGVAELDGRDLQRCTFNGEGLHV